ncbi:hypothetical protein S83_059741, partial [Arachis hypogaea]
YEGEKFFYKEEDIAIPVKVLDHFSFADFSLACSFFPRNLKICIVLHFENVTDLCLSSAVVMPLSSMLA